MADLPQDIPSLTDPKGLTDLINAFAAQLGVDDPELIRVYVRALVAVATEREARSFIVSVTAQL